MVSKLWKSSKQINYLKDGKVQFQQHHCNFFNFSQRILNQLLYNSIPGAIEEMNLLNYQLFTNKWHKFLRNIKSSFTSMILFTTCSMLNWFIHQLSKFHYMTISENNDGGVGDMEFSWLFFFAYRVFFHDHSRITGLQRKGKGISLTPH